jgi:hypothetical protein
MSDETKDNIEEQEQAAEGVDVYDIIIRDFNPWSKQFWNITRQGEILKARGLGYARRAALAAGMRPQDIPLPTIEDRGPTININENPWTDAGWNATKQGLYVKTFGEERAKAQAAKAGKPLVGPPPPSKRVAQEGPGLDWSGYMARKRAEGRAFGQKNFGKR